MSAIKYANLSICKKRKVGCVIRKNDEVIAYGFNHGFDEVCSCSMSNKNPHVLHAEQMALSGSDVEIYNGASLEVTYAPCEKCAVLIVQRKIKEVAYHDEDKTMIGVNYLKQNGVIVCKLKSSA